MRGMVDDEEEEQLGLGCYRPQVSAKSGDTRNDIIIDT